MRRSVAGLVLAACAALGASPAAAEPVEGFDGSNPFNCTIQEVGYGTAFPDPKADPFCVRFNKTRQNVNQLGVVEFLSQEPARVAAASDKCFYFQTDHWTGSVVQGDGRTETYNFEGSYFFDKARGAGGSFVREFRVGGQTGDPTTIPGFPPSYKPFFGQGRGGVQHTGGDFKVEQRCVELAGRKSVYRNPGAPLGCRQPGGRIGRGIGGITLRMRRGSVRVALGAPTSESTRAVRYCLDGGGTLSAGFLGASGRRRVVIVKVDNPAFSAGGVTVGVTERRARRVMRRERVRRRRDGTRLLISRGSRRTLVVAARNGRVAYIAVARPRVSLRTVARDLRPVSGP